MNNKKDIAPKNAKRERHGYWEVYLSNDNLFYKCIYHNGRPIVYEEMYGYSGGKLSEKRYYI